ncbi:TPA: cytochrome b [Pseudomonas aeruginosa]|nr:cytochrome b [Pseudomonas aeruginosa]
MAILFAWLFIGLGLEVGLGWHSSDYWVMPSHPNAGLLLGILAGLRSIWAIANWHVRPTYGTGGLAWCASVGHAILYGLMLVVPLLALVRWSGMGRDFALYGIVPILWSSTPKPAWEQFVEISCDATHLTLHGWLGWSLLAAIAGHLAMVGVHRFILNDGATAKMLGSSTLNGKNL